MPWHFWNGQNKGLVLFLDESLLWRVADVSETKPTGGSKKAASKKNSMHTKKSNPNPQTEQKNGSDIGTEVRFVVLLVASVFLFISNFGIGGAVGNLFSKLMFGCFGLISYVLPLIVLFLILFSLANRENLLATFRIVGVLLGCTALSTLFHMFAFGNRDIVWKNIYFYCIEHKTGGGLLGGSIAMLLKSAFGMIGTYLVIFGVLVICVVIVTGRSFVEGLSKGSKRVFDSAKQNMERRREAADNHYEEEQSQSSDQIWSGDVPDIWIPKEVSSEFKEIERKEPEIQEKQDSEILPEEKKEYFEQEKTTKSYDKKNFELAEKEDYQFPPIRFLKEPKGNSKKISSAKLKETAQRLQQILEDFGVDAAVTEVSQGPSVTRFEVQPAHGVKVNKIIALADDIKLNLAVSDIRIEAPIPGKAAVGIEVPNKENSLVMLRELLESEEFQQSPSQIAFAVGKDISGNIMISDIAKMPHLLIAGATGSGKSVCINTLIISILYKAHPNEVKLIMIDPKMVELSVYNGIPHLLIPVVTDPKKASSALNWAVAEMMERYQKFSDWNVRNIEGYNSKVDKLSGAHGGKKEKMPQIVIIVDELADLMMVAQGEVEGAICRLAQLARAAGIHLILATQRPSVNVITGLIKANMPSRIAFAVSSGVDSRTILDMNGAEKLLGKGDMLFFPSGLPKPLRMQGAFVSDAEVGAVVEFLSSQNTQNSKNSQEMEKQAKQIEKEMEDILPFSVPKGENDRDPLFADAGKFLIEKDKASIGMLQRWFRIGFNHAARIMDQLAKAGVVSEDEGTKPRKVLMSMEEFEKYMERLHD